jgi:glycosyltransferase involved in cell wall biosynthesis
VPALTVVIPTAGHPDRLRRTLRGLAHQRLTDFEVLVCDDGLDDATAEVCGEFSSVLDVFYSRTAVGQGAGNTRNRGIEIATAPRVLFLDDDCVAEREVTAWHAGWADMPVGLLGLRRMVQAPHHATLDDPTKLPPPQWHPEARASMPQKYATVLAAKGPQPDWHKYAWSCHVSYPLNKLLEVGGFWEAFRGAGFEDLEIGLRMSRAGVTLQPFAAPVVYHQNHPQSKHQSMNTSWNRARYTETVNDKAVAVRPGVRRPNNAIKATTDA